jgi:hypothetical protein
MFRRRSIPGNAQENIPLLRFSIYTLSLNQDAYSSTKGVARCHFLVMSTGHLRASDLGTELLPVSNNYFRAIRFRAGSYDHGKAHNCWMDASRGGLDLSART